MNKRVFILFFIVLLQVNIAISMNNRSSGISLPSMFGNRRGGFFGLPSIEQQLGTITFSSTIRHMERKKGVWQKSEFKRYAKKKKSIKKRVFIKNITPFRKFRASRPAPTRPPARLWYNGFLFVDENVLRVRRYARAR